MTYSVAQYNICDSRAILVFAGGLPLALDIRKRLRVLWRNGLEWVVTLDKPGPV